MDYMSIKWIHISCVALSISLFVLRGSLQLAGVAWRRWRVLRIAPHIVDSVLLLSAIRLAMLIHISPVTSCWLAAKVLALCAYILIGRLALRAPTPGGNGVSTIRAALPFMAALLVVMYIVGVAVMHSPSWGLAQRFGFVSSQTLIEGRDFVSYEVSTSRNLAGYPFHALSKKRMT